MNRLRNPDKAEAKTLVINKSGESEEAELEKEILAHQQKVMELENKKAAKLQEDEKRRLLIMTERKEAKARLLMGAEEWEKKATIYRNREDIDYALNEARTCRAQAEAIELPAEQLEEAAQTMEETEHPTWIEKILGHSGTLYAALVFLIILIAGSSYMVGDTGREINEINKLAADSGNMSQMIPPSVDKLVIQKNWYVLMTIGELMALVIVSMAFIAPAQLIFILPFTTNKTNRWKDFFGQTEEQKRWQSFAWFALVCLFFGLCLLAGSN